MYALTLRQYNRWSRLIAHDIKDHFPQVQPYLPVRPFISRLNNTNQLQLCIDLDADNVSNLGSYLGIWTYISCEYNSADRFLDLVVALDRGIDLCNTASQSCWFSILEALSHHMLHVLAPHITPLWTLQVAATFGWADDPQSSIQCILSYSEII